MPLRASSSARSFSGWPAWPLTQCQVTLCRRLASSSACQSSAFFTGFLSAVFQPFFFQPWIHLEMPSITYLLSVCRSTSQALFSASSAEIAANNSMRLLVVSASPPESSFSTSP
ncbi:hypothetical protein D9M70_605370 [compost metagenome]